MDCVVVFTGFVSSSFCSVLVLSVLYSWILCPYRTSYISPSTCPGRHGFFTLPGNQQSLHMSENTVSAFCVGCLYFHSKVKMRKMRSKFKIEIRKKLLGLSSQFNGTVCEWTFCRQMKSLTNTMLSAMNCYRLLSVVLGNFNQSALRALRVLRPLKLVTGFSSKYS